LVEGGVVGEVFIEVDEGLLEEDVEFGFCVGAELFGAVLIGCHVTAGVGP
jgi:hypothetical protein